MAVGQAQQPFCGSLRRNNDYGALGVNVAFIGTDLARFVALAFYWLLRATGLWSLFTVIVAAVIVRCALAYRRSFQAYVLSVLGAAVRQTLPLPEALWLEAGDSLDRRASALRRIAGGLMAGMSLHEAIRRGWPACPGNALALIESAERLNQLPGALASLEADLEQRRRDHLQFRSGHPIYPVAVVFLTLTIAMLLLTYVIPQFKDIHAGMGVPLPAVTQWVVDATDWYLAGVHPFVMLALPVAVVMYVYCLFRPRRPERPLLLSRMGDWIKWRLPVLRWFERNGSLVQAAEALRISLRAGATVDAAVANAAAMDTNACYRKRLRRWLDRIRRGEDVSAAAARCGVGRGIAWAMDARTNPTGSMDALETVEDLHRANYSYAVTVARTVFWPCVTIGMGVMVAVLALVVVGPMAAIVHAGEAMTVPK